tara:strand:+ start:2262 stop:2555 length:294 start_codon:yes stop_codon:yes gene_type:complete
MEDEEGIQGRARESAEIRYDRARIIKIHECPHPDESLSLVEAEALDEEIFMVVKCEECGGHNDYHFDWTAVRLHVPTPNHTLIVKLTDSIRQSDGWE